MGGSSRSVKSGGLTLTLGNSKMGRVMNLSLPPPASCDTAMPCFARGQCYAMKHAYNVYGSVREAWNGNMRVWLDRGAAAYFAAVREAVGLRRPALFRWHVGGDIPDVCAGADGSVTRTPEASSAYIGGMCAVADAFPETRFWCFTKRYAAVRANAGMIRGTPNLNVVLSAWPGVPLDGRTRRAWPVAYVRSRADPDPRIPESAHRCGGRCDSCMLCADIGPGEAVVLDKH